jgi:hypothetical protein
MTSLEAVPAVPRAGCFADVAAPEGSGREAADTGCVTPEPSTKSRVEETVRFAGTFESIEEREEFAVLWFAAVAAPVGNGREEALTG